MVVRGIVNNATNRVQRAIMLKVSIVTQTGISLDSKRHACCGLTLKSGDDAQGASPQGGVQGSKPTQEAVLEPGQTAAFEVAFEDRSEAAGELKPQAGPSSNLSGPRDHPVQRRFSTRNSAFFATFPGRARIAYAGGFMARAFDSAHPSCVLAVVRATMDSLAQKRDWARFAMLALARSFQTTVHLLEKSSFRLLL